MTEPAAISRRARLAACALFLIAAWALFFWRILGEGRVPVFRDIIDTTVPLGQYIGTRLREGHLPQWFPYEGLGEPFIGQLNESTFHPITWLYAVLPVTAALRWELLLGYLAAAIGQLLLARKLGLGSGAATLAAVVFAFSGYAVSLSNVLPYLWGLASLPWLGLFAARICTSERPWPWVAAQALCWASIVLAGDSHSALFGGLVVLFVVAVNGNLRRLPLCVLGGALALGLSAAELIPAVEIVRAGPRTGWDTAAKMHLLSTFWALHPYRLPELLLPGWLPLKTVYLFSNAIHGEGGMWAVSVYSGLVPALLAIAALWGRTRRGVLAAALAVLGLWLALGVHGGLEPLVRRTVPGLTVLRYPEKYLGLCTFGLSLAAGAGLDRLRNHRTWAVPALFAVAAAACALPAAILAQDAPLRFWPQLASLPGETQKLHDAWQGSLASAAIMLAVTAAILALGMLRPRLVALLPLAVFLDLWLVAGGLIGVAPSEVFTELPRFCDAARSAGASPAGVRALNASTRFRRLEEMDAPGVWAALSLNLLQPASSALCGIGSIWTYPTLSNEPRRVRTLIGRQHLELSPPLQLFGFGLVVRALPEDPPVPGERVLEVLEIDGQKWVLVQRPAAPRAYAAVPRWTGDILAARREVQERGLALVESPILVGDGPAPDGTGSAGSVRISSYQPEHVVLEADLSRPGAVILNDLHARGWTATLDGAPARIHAANALVRGVLAPAGRHRIEMSFELPGLRTGLSVAAVSLLACAVLVAAGRRRRPGPPTGAAALSPQSPTGRSGA